jgi:hypothetical protein
MIDAEHGPAFGEIFNGFGRHEIDTYLKQVGMSARITAPLMPIKKVPLPRERDNSSVANDPFLEALAGSFALFKQVMGDDFDE